MFNGDRKTAARTRRAQASVGVKAQRARFVITGSGNNTDNPTGRVLKINKTCERLLPPVCDKVNVNRLRAIDVNLVGSIIRSCAVGSARRSPPPCTSE